MAIKENNEQQLMKVAVVTVAISLIAVVILIFNISAVLFTVLAIVAIASGTYLAYKLSQEQPSTSTQQPQMTAKKKRR